MQWEKSSCRLSIERCLAYSGCRAFVVPLMTNETPLRKSRSVRESWCLWSFVSPTPVALSLIHAGLVQQQDILHSRDLRDATSIHS